MSEEPIILNPEGRFAGLIVVDHAGTTTPARFGDLGLEPHWQDTHHYCDLGVEPLARRLAQRLDVPVILGTVSRLVIDLNRWIDDPRSVVTHVDDQPVPGNLDPDAPHRKARQEGIFWPYHNAVAQLWDQITARHADPLFFALHTCTRHFDGFRRPWDGGTIWNETPVLAHGLLNVLDTGAQLKFGDNQPYSGRGGVYTLDRHTWGGGHRACGFEVTNDLLDTAEGQAEWAQLLGDALAAQENAGMRQ